MFQHLWADDGNQKLDLVRDGELSCAIFVSSILKLFDLIGSKHATVDSTIKDMLASGWKEVKLDKIELGDVIVWNILSDKNNQSHGHIGFYIGDQKAVSNSRKLRYIVRHGWNYGGRREIVQVLRWLWKN